MRTATLSRLFAVLAFAVFLFSTFPSPSSARGDTIFIHLKAKTFDPLRGAPSLAQTDVHHFIVQFKGPILPSWKEELESVEGCTIISYVPDYAYLVRLENPSSAEQIRRMPSVRWVGPYLPEYKIHPNLRSSGEAVVTIVLDSGAPAAASEIEKLGVRLLGSSGCLLRARVSAPDLTRLASLDDVLWLEPFSQPVVYNENATWVIQSGVYQFRPIHENGLRGENQLITISDTGIRVTHEMFYDSENIGINHRKIQAYYVPEGAIGALGDESGHGTHVSGTVAGDAGNLFVYDANKHDGHAFAAKIIVQDIDNDPDPYIYPPDDFFNLFLPAYDVGSLIHTNSWGSDAGYTSESRRIDEFAWLHKDFTVLFGMGNSGPGSQTLSAQAEAKNAISVGATSNGTLANNMPSWSSRGPTEDNRIKPTVVAPGQTIWSADYSGDTAYASKSGTSMATPAVAAAVALIRQYYEEGWYPEGRKNPAHAFEPSAALLKATLIAGAVEITGSYAYYNGYFYPNWDQGWGRVNLNNSLYFEGESRRLWVVDNRTGLATGQTATYFISVLDNTQPLRFVLCWTDYPGNPAASIQLVNDLDLRVTDPDGNVYLGNVFAGYNPGFSVTGGSPDNRNTEEAVILVPENNHFPAGVYKIEVVGRNVPMGENGTNAQPFALAVVGGISPVQQVLPAFTWTQTNWEGGPKNLDVGRFARSYAWFYSSENISWENPGRIGLASGKTSGWLESNIFDSHRISDWKEPKITASTPPGTSVVLKLRTGMDNNPYDGGWSDWVVHTSGQENQSLPNGRYIQYRIEMFRSSPNRPTPEVSELQISYTAGTLPSPPILSPALGENIQINQPVIRWDQVASPFPPILYNVWLDNDPDFSSVDASSGWTENLSWTVSLPLSDGVWHVRVQARDNAGNFSENSESWFRVDTVAPPSPLLFSPAEGEVLADNTPALVWQNVNENSLPIVYTVEVDNENTFTSPLFTATVENGSTSGTSSVEVSPALADGVYYWRARATDNAGNTGGWSEIRSFKIDSTPPPVPALLFPASGEHLNLSSPTLFWQNVIDNSLPVLYLLSVSNDPTFQTEIRSSGWISSTSWTVSPPLPDGRYYWRVKARDNAGNEGPWSEIWSFSIDTVPPTPPLPLSPSNGSALASPAVILSWSEVSENSAPVSYLVSVSRFPDFSAESASSGWITSTSWTAFLPDGVYYWRVKARDSAGNQSGWSQIFSFKLDTTAPPPPSPASPAENSVVTSAPTLEWLGVADQSPPVLYFVQISSSLGFGESITSGWLAETSWQARQLSDGLWFWRVKARDSLGNEGPWSAARSFLLDTTPPETPSITSPTHPAGAPTPRSSVVFTWAPVGGPSQVTYLFMLENYENAWRFTSGTQVSYENIPDGTFTLRLKARDAGGESGEATYTVVIDTTPSAVELQLRPASENESGWTLRTSSRVFKFGGRVEPGALVEVGGTSVRADENGFFTVDLPLQSGSNLFLLRVVDRAGNVTEKTMLVQYSPPGWFARNWPLLLAPMLAASAFLAVRRIGEKRRRKRRR